MSRRKHWNLFQINFMWHRSLHKEMKIWSSKLDLSFHIRVDEERSHGNVWQGVKGQELSAVNWEAAGFFLQFPLSVSLSSKVRRSFPLDRRIWHLSAEELSSCFRGRSGSPPCTCPFHRFLSYEFVTTPRYHVMGVLCPEVV